jgi:hypothetical protein
MSIPHLSSAQYGYGYTNPNYQNNYYNFNNGYYGYYNNNAWVYLAGQVLNGIATGISYRANTAYQYQTMPVNYGYYTYYNYPSQGYRTYVLVNTQPEQTTISPQVIYQETKEEPDEIHLKTKKGREVIAFTLGDTDCYTDKTNDNFQAVVDKNDNVQYYQFFYNGTWYQFDH